MSAIRIVICFSSLVFSSVETYKIRQVSTSIGDVRGRFLTTYGNQSGYAFLGIPLAKSPIGDLRFRKPVDPPPWNSVLDVFHYRNACLSDSVKTYKRPEGGPVSEDCLYLNVFASQSCLDKGGCAVAAIVHGGRMVYESSVGFKEEILVNNFANEERNVVVVSLPYRLGLIGWINLSQNKDSTDTNIGLRDLLFGLKWIQREVKSFGGDPNRVTYLGHSAGAHIGQLLTASPLSVGLYQQIITMSAPNFGGDRSTMGNIMFSRKLSMKLGCAKEKTDFYSSEVVEQVLSCLRRIPEDVLLKEQLAMRNEIEWVTGPWIDGPGGVLPDYIKELLVKHHRPMKMLIGTVSAETRSSRFAVDFNGNAVGERVKELCEHTAFERNYERPENFITSCVDHYSLPNKTQLFDDDLEFYYPVGMLANGFSESADTFVYSFEYEEIGEAFMSGMSMTQNAFSPSHAQDWMYVTGLHRNENKFTEKDKQIERIYTGILANFVNSGDPTFVGQKWEKWNKERRNFFKINFDKDLKMPGMAEGYYTDAHDFWHNIAKEKGGDWRPLTDFPPKVDTYEITIVVGSLATKWVDKKELFEKEYSAGIETYNIFTDWVNLQKSKRAALLRSEEVEETDEGLMNEPSVFNWLTSVLIAVLILLVLYICAEQFASWQKRKDYQRIVN